MRLAGIKTIPAVNLFLKPDFLPRFNKQFSILPREYKSFYKWPETELNLENVFCIKENRKIPIASTFSWNGDQYQVTEDTSYRFGTIFINTHYEGHTTFDILGKNVSVKKKLTGDENKYKMAS